MENLKENQLEVIFQTLNYEWKLISNNVAGDKKLEYYKFSFANLSNNDSRIIGYDLNDVEFIEISSKKKNYYIPALIIKSSHKSSKWVIGVHNFMSNKESMIYWLINYIDKGYNILVYDISNHGENYNTFNSFGIYETDELLDVIKFLFKKNKVKEIGLHGIGLGAYIINRFILTNDIEKFKICFAISDCAFFDYKDYLASIIISHSKKILSNIKNYNIDTVVRNYITYIKKRFDIDNNNLTLYNYIKNCKKTVPVLYFASEKEGISSIKDSYNYIFSRVSTGVNDTFYHLQNKNQFMGLFEAKDEYLNEIESFINLVHN